jgi:hypothetical protein
MMSSWKRHVSEIDSAISTVVRISEWGQDFFCQQISNDLKIRYFCANSTILIRVGCTDSGSQDKTIRSG